MRAAAFIRVLYVAVFALPLLSEAAMQRKNVAYTVGAEKFEGVLLFDDATRSPRPGLVLFPNWLGINDANLRQAAEITGKGFVVLVADMYGLSARPKDRDAAMKVVGPIKADRALMRARARAALDALLAQAKSAPLDTGRVGAIGFCFGGTTAIELAKSGAKVAGVVSFHGGLDAPVPTQEKPAARVLALHGADDPTVSEADLKAFKDDLRKSGADWTLVEFGGAVHSFTDVDANTPGRSKYDEKTARRAYEMMRDFFAETFGHSR